jgi:hypothetical protein
MNKKIEETTCHHEGKMDNGKANPHRASTAAAPAFELAPSFLLSPWTIRFRPHS